MKQFADFWDNHYDDMMVVSSYYMNEYLTNNNFTKEEMIAYKK